MIEFLLNHLNTFLGSFVVALVAWFFSRKRSQIENAEHLLKYYQNVATDLGNRLDEAIMKINEAQKTIKELEETVEDLTDELRKYKQLNGKRE